MVNAQMLHLRGAVALGAATATRGAPEAPSLLRVAERAADHLLRSRIVRFRPTGLLLRAGIHAARGDRTGAGALLQAAARGFDTAEMSLYAAAARRRHAEMIGGASREADLRAADDCMTQESIRDPARFTRMLAPGFDR